VAYFKALTDYSPEEIEKNHAKPSSGRDFSRVTIKWVTSVWTSVAIIIIVVVVVVVVIIIIVVVVVVVVVVNSNLIQIRQNNGYLTRRRNRRTF
jgi:uncharacterized membrane protein